MRYPRLVQLFAGCAATLYLLGAAACSPSRPLLPASAFAETFDPMKTLATVAEREGLALVRRGISSCDRGTSSSIDQPTTTSMTCRGSSDFRSREEAVRLNRALFQELENQLLAHSGRADVGRGGSPDRGEFHLQTCTSGDPGSDEPGTRACLFLHAFAVEIVKAQGTVGVSYFFTLDEERTRQSTADQRASR